MIHPRFACFYLALTLSAAAADPPVPVKTTPKLEILNQQIAANAENAQAYSNRGYVLALLGRKEEARADVRKSVELHDKAPMHNRAGWAYFNMGDYTDAVREFETAAKMSDFQAHYDYYSLVLGCWGTGDTQRALENYQRWNGRRWSSVRCTRSMCCGTRRGNRSRVPFLAGTADCYARSSTISSNRSRACRRRWWQRLPRGPQGRIRRAGRCHGQGSRCASSRGGM
jgi:hypothetical protein